MAAAKLPELAIRTFEHHFRLLGQGETGLLGEQDIQPVTDVPDAAALAGYRQAGEAALGQCAVVKLNGGLGTSMGLNSAKALLPARANHSFLDLIAQQVLYWRRQSGHALPLLLMNSFATESDSLRALDAYPDLPAGQHGVPLSFLQHRVPRLDPETLQPVRWPDEPRREWCPPGHGDLYTALVTSGLLETLLQHDVRYLFVANADNLGATLDLDILGFIASERIPFLMEVTERTAADRKGGHLARDQRGGLLLRESAQCPPDDLDHFQDIERHRYFNTNNLWLDLDALADAMHSRDGILGLPLMRNLKHVVPDDPATPLVIQVETAMGAAINVFNNAQVVRVPRTRFAPVKTTSDLLVLWSDRYQLDRSGTVSPQTQRPIEVALDPRWYASIDAFRARFPAGAPSLIDADMLSVSGDIRFSGDVTVRGTVRLRNDSNTTRVIAAGTCLEDLIEDD